MSDRSDNCVSSGSYAYMTGAEFDVPSLSTPCNQYGNHSQHGSPQQPAPSYDYMTGAEFAGPCFSRPRDQHSSHAQRVSAFQQPASLYVQPMSCAGQMSAMQSLYTPCDISYKPLQ